MTLEDLFKGRVFYTKEGLRDYLNKKYGEVADQNDFGVVFLHEGRRKKTSLFFGKRKVYKITDNKLRLRPIINLSIDKDKFFHDSDKIVKVDEGTRIVFPNKLGSKYLFDRRLFKVTSLQSALREAFEKSN